MKELNDIKKEILIYGRRSINCDNLKRLCKKIEQKEDFNKYKKEELIDYLLDKIGFEAFNDIKISKKNIQSAFDLSNPDMVMLHRKMGKAKVIMFGNHEYTEIDDYYFSELEKIYDYVKEENGYQYVYLYSDKEEVLGDMVESMLTIYDLKCMKTEKIEENYKFSAYAKIKQNAL